MSYNGSGTFQINTSGQPVVTGTVISSSAFNALTADLATGLSTAITKDGQTATTVRIPFAQGINSSLVTDTTSGSTGSIITSGGVGIAKALYVGTNATVVGTLGVTGAATFSTNPVFSALTASSAVATDASKNLVSVTNTGTGSNVLATSPTLVTPVLGAASATSVTVGAGTAAAPAITTTGDTNTGIFFPAADTIAFSEGGAESMRIDSSGNVLVGQTTAAVETGSIVTAKNLEITRTIDSDGGALGQLSWVNNTNAGVASGTSFAKDVACIKGLMDGTGNNSGGYLTFETKADANTRAERMRIDSSGRVGIGTTSPTGFLNVDGTGGDALPATSGSTQSAGLITRLQQGGGVGSVMDIGGNGGTGSWIQVTEASNLATNYSLLLNPNGGRLLVGTTSANSNEKVRIKNTDDTRAIAFQSGSSAECGYIYINAGGTGVTYSTSSDYRLKENIVLMTGALAKVAQLKPVTYTWKINGSHGQGFIAHELAEVVPDCVTGEKDAVATYIDEDGNETTRPAYQGIDTSFLVATLTAAIQELTARVMALEAK
jgi:hypothetical protein